MSTKGFVCEAGKFVVGENVFVLDTRLNTLVFAQDELDWLNKLSWALPSSEFTLELTIDSVFD
jgi:hypothetical protein